MKKKPSLLIIGNSNVGKSTIAKLLLPNPKEYKGKTGKKPGSTLLIKSISQPSLSYNIVDLPGFGYMKKSSRRREEHIKTQIVVHIEKNYEEFFLGLVILNILRIEDELDKYFVQNKNTIPLSFEMITFLKEFKIPILILLNKIDKLSNYDKNRIIDFFVESAFRFGLELAPFKDFKFIDKNIVPYLEFSALKKINLSPLNKFINYYLNKA
ncbi:MAG: hypothetical protein GF383_00695 [Candidatus Lokiarchaeota archaeon]|nr:hypothetical protein [Candidatus Lokiarchaeota archaeon]MBD3337691.1 hypothetical protein [Candidatus Lokiarchaeota archaeon]